jgi:hypothetical protein
MKYLEKIKTYPIHHALGGTEQVSLEQNAIEFAIFCDWLEANEIKTVLEVGMAYGYLSKFLTEEMGIKCEGLTDNQDMLLWRPEVLYVGDSLKVGPQTGKYDLIFIDGDHYQVQKDFEMFYAKARYFAFHDICGFRDCMPVLKFWKKIKKQYNHYEFIDFKHIDHASGIGVLDRTNKPPQRGRPRKGAVPSTTKNSP